MLELSEAFIWATEFFDERVNFEIKNHFMFSFQGGSVHKSVVLIFFQGDQLKSRIAKICDS